MSPTFLGRSLLAATGTRKKVLVTIFQRGAMDGLMAVPPLSDRHLAGLRPRLTLSGARSAGENRLIDLDGEFGLHPAFSALSRYWEEGRLGIVHAVGSPDPTRSHFDAQDYMETGTPGLKGTSSGWLNRASGLLGHEATAMRSVSITSSLPRSLYGEQPALAVAKLDDLQVKLPGGEAVLQAVSGGFEALYENTAQNLLRDAGAETFEAVKLIEEFREARARNGANYPQSELGESLRQIATLIRADVGLEIAFAETGGWDTHVAQGTFGGTFANRARDLANSIEAFWTDLGNHRDDVVVLTMTEFGRTARENGSGGTDHGHGSCLFVLGDEIDGGKVHGDFPSLHPDALYEGRDLPVTTDFRSVFSGVATGHLGFKDDGSLFPGWTGPSLDLRKGKPSAEG